MRTINIRFIIPLVLFAHAGFSQFTKESAIYFDKNWNKVSEKGEADFYRIVEPQEEDSYIVRDYFISGNLQMEAQCKTYDPIKFHGLRKLYYEDGKLQQEGMYSDHQPTGVHKAYYSNSQLKTAISHDDKKARYVHFNDSLGNDLLRGGNVILAESDFIDSSTGAKWLQYVDIKNFDQIGTFSVSTVNLDTIYGLVEKQATYGNAEGYTDLTHDISKNLKYPGKAKLKGISGRVYVGFVVDKTGNVRDIKVLKGIFKQCDEEAMRVITALKRWHPAYHRNKPVSTRFVLPIVFTLR